MPSPADGPRKAALMPILRSRPLTTSAPAPRGSTPPRAGAWAQAVRPPRTPPTAAPERIRRSALRCIVIPPVALLAERAQKSGRIEQRNEPLAVGQEPERPLGVRLWIRLVEARDPAEGL